MTTNPPANNDPVTTEYQAHPRAPCMAKEWASTKQAAGSVVNTTNEQTSCMRAVQAWVKGRDPPGG